MYGAQTTKSNNGRNSMFENDVEMYGAQTHRIGTKGTVSFENDVEMYGAQTKIPLLLFPDSLRMM